VRHVARRYPTDGRIYRALRLRLGGLRRIAALFPDAGLVVDLGCGTGLLGHCLLAGGPGRSVLGIDHDEARLAQAAASTRGLAFEVRPGDMATAAIPPCAGVALVDVLHYLGSEAQEDVLRRAATALGPGGTLVLRDPDRSAALRYPLARLHEAIALRTGFTKATRGRYRSGAAWAALLASLGLETQVLPLSWFSPYPDRVVVGRKP
jgi:trans-aconitate methyltransferase